MSLITEIYVDSSHKKWGIYIPSAIVCAYSGAYNKKVTTNEGEFMAMEYALEKAREFMDVSELIIIYSDSQLVVKCLNGKWRVKPQHLIKCRDRCGVIFDTLKPKVRIHWIPREKNKEADALTHE